MNYRFETHARQELRDAVAYYDSIDSRLGDGFREEVERAISLIRQFPEVGPNCRLPQGAVARSDFLTELFTA